MKQVFRLGLLSLIFGIGSILATPQSVHAAISCDITPNPAPSGSIAQLSLKFKSFDGSAIETVYTLNDVCPGSDSIVTGDPSGFTGTRNSTSTNIVTRTATGGTDYYAYTSRGGNGIYLDCRQLQGPNPPHGNNGKTAVFNIDIPLKAGGTWSASDDFTVSNGGTTFLTYTWTPDAPPSNATLDGFKIDSANNAYPAAASPGNSAVTVTSAGSSTGNPFSFNTITAGAQTVSIVVPSGYTASYKICSGSTCNPDIAAAIAGSSFSYSFSGGITYHMRWILSLPPAVLQGYKVGPDGTALAATSSPGNATVTVVNVGTTNNNAFFFNGGPGNGPSIPGGATYTVSVPSLTGYSIKYKICDNSVPACNVGDFTTGVTAGTSFSYTFASGKTYDMRWIYTSAPVGSAPTGTFIASCSTLSGTAHDTDTPNQGVTVRIKEGGSIIASAVSSSSPVYGYSTSTPGSITDGNPHTLSAFALDTTSGAEVELVGSPATLTCGNTHHKIFAVNFLKTLKSYIRDNESFNFNILTYIFPDAGLKGSNHLWTAGIYDNTGGNSDNAANARLSAITSINNIAEKDCYDGNFQGASCKQRVPLAYVPQNDGSGRPGNTTPNGNIWLSLRNNSVSGASQYKGGIASTDTTNVGGYSGVRLNVDEISNIRVNATGISTTANSILKQYGQLYQGKVPTNNIQADVRDTLNLPVGSQNANYQGWDNVRNPNKINSGYTANVTNPNIDFANTSGSPTNFNVDFSNLASQINSFTGVQYANGTAVSYLQDGHSAVGGRTYANQSEPLTLSGQVSTIGDAQLKWDEYVEWSQVDDKGHYRATNASGVATGYELGTYTDPHYETLHYFSGGNTGSPVYQYTYYYYSCTNYNTNPPTTTFGSGTSVPNGCSSYYSYAVYDYSQSCTSTGPTYAYNTSDYRSYSTPNSESQFGWVNTQATTGTIPKGSNGQNATSYFSFQNGAGTPSWAITGSKPYWQDTDVTAMLNSGSTAKPSHSDTWIYNITDALYTNRMIYDGTGSVSFKNGYQVGGTQSQCWYSASGSGGYGPNDNSYSQYIDGYYASSRYLYENSSAPTTPYYGLYGNSATFDGITDGVVDTGWTWVTNKSRVRYENTWNGRNRGLGARAISDFGGIDALDTLLYGVDKDGSGNYATTALPGRGNAVIYNPTIQAANGDIYSGRNIDSYFTGSGLSSAFLFAGGLIQNFSSSNNLGGLNFPGYFPNPTKPDGTPSGNRTSIPGTSLDPIHSVFRDFDATFTPAALAVNGSLPNSLNSAFNLSSNPTRVYKVGGSGNLTLNPGISFCNGAGSIYVPGDLTINGDVNYCSYSGSRAGLPSVGFIVGGKVIVSPNVSTMVGAYFAQSSFSSGSIVTTTNRSSSDKPLTILGLVIANSFNLQRQLGSASFNQSGGATPSENTPEKFIYDGRIVVSPPPGFSDLYNASASWNQSVPYN